MTSIIPRGGVREILAGLLFAASVTTLLGAPAPNFRAGTSVDTSRAFESSRTPVIVPTEQGISLTTTEAAPVSPGDQDLGEQRLFKFKEKERPFTISADFGGFATNNVALVENGRFEDQFLVSQVSLGYHPKITANLSAEISLRQAFFRYNRFPALDFDSQNFALGLTYVAPNLWNLAFFGRYNYNRLLDATEGDEIFTNHTFTVGFQKVYEISRAHYCYAGYASVFGIGHPGSLQRDEHGAYFGYHVNLSRSLQADLFYRIAAFDYTSGRVGRTDLNETLNATLQYKLANWLQAYASVALALNYSDQDRLDYDAFTAGLGLTATFRF